MLENGRKIPAVLLILIIAVFVTAGCVQPEPTPEPTAPPTQQPTQSPTSAPPTTVTPTTPPSPTTKLVSLPPQQLILKTDQFPLSGYSVTDDEAFGEDGWRRTFVSTSELSEYWWVDPHVFMLDAPPKSAPSASETCKWDGQEKSDIAIEAPTVGDYAIACKITFAATTPIFQYTVYTRNVKIVLEIAPKDTTPDNQVLDFLVALAQYQIVIIDRASPPGLVTITAGAQKFQFNAPSTLTVTAGKDFKYSFCDPEPATPTSPCGPIPATKNPSGGNPSYHFVLGPGTGFPPFSLSLSKDGVLKGKVSSTEVGKTHTIEVCAIDLNADAVCRKVTISVSAPQTPTPTPTPTLKCPQESPLRQYEKTAWSGKLHLDFYSEQTYDATVQFTFGTASADYDCDTVPVVSGQVTDGSRTWKLDAERSSIHCELHSSPGVCGNYEFILRFDLASGSSKVGRFEVAPLFFRVQDRASGQILSPTQIKGPAGGGCCYWGTFTASRS